MSYPYQELRLRARALALATLFDAPQERDICCDMMQLGIELEKIIDIASEPMLAMIRMQWWHDFFDAEHAAQDAPEFAKRLHKLGKPVRDSMNAMLQDSQDSLQTEHAFVAWGALFTTLARANKWEIDEAVIKQIGTNLGALYAPDKAPDYQPLSDADIKTASCKKYGFPRLVNLLITRQMAGKSDQDYLLIFRYLLRVLF